MSYINSKHKNMSFTSGQFIPEGVKENAKGLETLIKAYYEWAESEGQFQKESKALADSFNYKTADDNYLLFFKDTLLRLFPDNNKTILRHLMKFSKTFYAERGTPESYEFLFRAIWDADVRLSFPHENILKTSDGVWVERILLKIDTTTYTENLIGKTLFGKKSKARALISEINKTVNNTTEVVLETISTDFIVNETVEIYNDNKLESLSGKTRTVGSLGSYKIINPGKGYRGGAKLSIKSNGDGEDFDAEIYAADNLTGKILALNILNAGFNYVYTYPTLNMSDRYLFDSRAKDQEVAVIELISVANYKEPGKYLKPKSLLSDNFKLHDGDYYQDFSYVLETKLEYDVIYKPVMELLHPAGTKMFYKKLYNNNANIIDFDIKVKTPTALFSFKEPSTVIYSNGFDYNGALSFYEY